VLAYTVVINPIKVLIYFRAGMSGFTYTMYLIAGTQTLYNFLCEYQNNNDMIIFFFQMNLKLIKEYYVTMFSPFTPKGGNYMKDILSIYLEHGVYLNLEKYTVEK